MQSSTSSDLPSQGAPREVLHPTADQLQKGLGHILQSPKEQGVLEAIVRRPRVDERELLERAVLDVEAGLVGDNWRERGSAKTEDGTAHPEMQLNLMNSRAVALVAGQRERWQLAGDQLYLDLDLSSGNLPPGTRLALGDAVIEVTAEPHTGCKKFLARFGVDALRFVNSPEGRRSNLRGINAKVIQSGEVRVGQTARRIVDH